MSPKECQENYCQINDKCTSFVYNAKTKTCNLKKIIQWELDETELVYEEGKTFGPKYCPGIITLILFYLRLFYSKISINSTTNA